MDKITSFMRVTKKRKALDDSGVLKPVVAAKAPVVEPAAATLKKPKKATTAVQETDADGELYENGIHVPSFIYATVHYTRKTAPHAVDTKTQRVVDFVTEHFELPLDFETSSRFGPHSGFTYEARLLRAYKLKLLAPKNKSKTLAPMCITCATEGHVDRDCPDGF